MSLDGLHHIESLPPKNRVTRRPGSIDRFDPSNQPPHGYPLSASVRPNSRMGMRKHPKTGTNKLHRGVDLPVNNKTCYATSAGRVIEVGYQSGGAGNYVVINHGNGYVTRYFHLKSINSKIESGVMTTDRQVLGTTGATGSVTGPHLHYEVLYLDYPVAYISRKRVPLDKRINPETTFAPKRYEDGTSVRTLAGYRKNLKTSKSDKTDIQGANDYLLTQLSEIEDDDEYEDADENRVELVPVGPEDKISVVPPRVAIYHVESEVAMRTNSFRAKPQQSGVLPMIQLYRSGIEFDLHGYSLTEETWIKNNLAKLANYIINTARELTSSDYQKFIMPLLNQYGIQYEASNYHSDLSIILKLCSLIRGGNASSSSAQISAGGVVSNPGSNTKEVKKQNIVIDGEFRTKVEKIHQPLTNKSTILEALGIDNYKHIPRILDNFKEYKTYVLDPTNDSESIIWARKYYLLSSKVARDIMNQFYLPKPNEKGGYVERQKQYVGRFKDFASAMSIVYGKAISQPPTIEKDIAIWALIIADNNKTIVNLEKIINK